MNPNTLVADPEVIEIDKFISSADSITIVGHSVQKKVFCPSCNISSNSLKCRYIRRIADLPWHNVAIRLELKVRKFRCRNSLCTRKVFCERLPRVASHYARRTTRFNEILNVLAFALGGRGTARVADKLIFSRVGKDASLELMRRSSQETPLLRVSPVKVLGVDDFAFRKGINYGTILVDLEKRRPIDLLPDREAKTLAQWLENNPQVEIVTRDRSLVYAEGIRNGAPNAVQVADRWHLLKNLRESGRRFLMREHKLLQEAVGHLAKTEAGTDGLWSWRRRISLSSHSKNINKEEERRSLYHRVRELHKKGLSERAIARVVNLHRATIRRFIHAEEYPYKANRALRPSMLDPYVDYLEKRLREGCWNGEQLWREIKERGYPGGTKMVRRYVFARRKETNQSVQPDETAKAEQEIKVPLPVPSVEQVSWWIILESDKLKPDEKEFIESLTEVSDQVRELSSFSHEFVKIIKEKDENLFADWLRQAQNSQVKEIKNFALGIGKDEESVRQAVISEWSNGQTEGQVNRLKTIKRQMYGRTNFDLLRARVLYQN